MRKYLDGGRKAAFGYLNQKCFWYICCLLGIFKDNLFFQGILFIILMRLGVLVPKLIFCEVKRKYANPVILINYEIEKKVLSLNK